MQYQRHSRSVDLVASSNHSTDVNGFQTKLEGIGVVFKLDKAKRYFYISRVIENGAAYAHGNILPGDIFVEVDGVKVHNKTPDELAQLILGPPGSMVDLVLRQGSIIKEISVKRARQQANDIGSTPTKLPSDLKLAYQIPMPSMQMQQVLPHDHRYVHPDPSRSMRNPSDSPPLLMPANSLPRTVHAGSRNAGMQDTRGLPHVDDRYFEMSTRPPRASDMPDISRISLHSQMPMNRSKEVDFASQYMTFGQPPANFQHNHTPTVQISPIDARDLNRQHRNALPGHSAPHAAMPSADEILRNDRAQSVWVMRHGMRLDDQDPTWKLSASRPYDPPICEHGREQCKLAGMSFKSSRSQVGDISFVLSSPFLRCVQTAAEVASILGISRIFIENDICEVLELRNVSVQPKCLKMDQLVKVEPMLAHHEIIPSSVKMPSWPENLHEARVRFRNAFDRIAKSYDGNVLIVTHGDTVAEFISMTSKIQTDKIYSVPNCSAAGARHVDGCWDKCTLSGEILILDQEH
ncbi:hypothetical protein GUITHDRAFT_142692 [Guillardia theta CCMP2712]|uniref:PDZ domain-containing protein n=1 Tax=Guillardia theta (strain CCMP2712) TaxID=905079 RepID=L1IWI6_GUITC|nr:hypothetical protein GUITHDRAFT_142692 [Guillardia theta CCMP2712]EKX40601.1 hypothetical protein GUITHDRAFT_142692 [Guillardia theta CCMP2712]|eukprot:XP_005827581.1 hypothetical protein GUITHDRAFT_142692 [Guillardia theta CCMP2712]